MKALIDMDLIVYRVGSACDCWHYKYAGQRFDSHKELKMHLKRECSDDEEAADKLKLATRERDPEDWESTKTSVISFTEDLIEPFDDYVGYISGKGNFRYALSKILPYKANRSDDTKPFHYDAIRQLLVDAYNAKMSVNMEADDCLGLEQTDPKGMETCICSLDKDLDMIPGVHYNWDHDQHYVIEEVDAARSFYSQMLIGDSTDNILGLYGVGEKSKLVKNIKLMEDEAQMKQLVEDEYHKRFGGYFRTFLQENARLLWILRSDKKNPFSSEDKYWEG